MNEDQTLNFRLRTAHILYHVTVLLVFVFAAWVVYFITTKSSRLDFRVFYGAALAAAKGESIYTLYGIYMMPFWYFPWVAWLYRPLALLSFSEAWYTYVLLCCGLLWIILGFYSDRFNVTTRLIDKIFMYGISLLLCMMLFNFGQTNIIVLGLATLVLLFMQREKYFAAGLVLPFVLIKPHLLILFVIACLLKGGKKTWIGAGLSSLFMFGIEFILDPGWVSDFLRLFAYGALRNEKLYWGHTTLPALLGLEENFVGTANLPIIMLLILIGALVIWQYRRAPPAQLMALGLAASLFCAPRAFGYDLIFLLPAMLLLSENFNWKTFLFWMLVVSIAFLFNFSTGSYILTLLVFGLSIWKLKSKGTHFYDTLSIQHNP